jgi:hypothetical protein
LASRAQVASDLENRIQQLQTLLAEAQAEIQAKASSVQELEHAKMDLEVKYQGELDASSKQSDELSSSTAAQLAAADEKVGTCNICYRTLLNLSLKGRRVAIRRAGQGGVDRVS